MVFLSPFTMLRYCHRRKLCETSAFSLFLLVLVFIHVNGERSYVTSTWNKKSNWKSDHVWIIMENPCQQLFTYYHINVFSIAALIILTFIIYEVGKQVMKGIYQECQLIWIKSSVVIWEAKQLKFFFALNSNKNATFWWYLRYSNIDQCKHYIRQLHWNIL